MATGGAGKGSGAAATGSAPLTVPAPAERVLRQMLNESTSTEFPTAVRGWGYAGFKNGGQNEQSAEVRSMYYAQQGAGRNRRKGLDL
jgi:hypothetical protein